MESQKKEQYVIPEVNAVNVAVESGFAQSGSPAVNTVNASSMEETEIGW